MSENEVKTRTFRRAGNDRTDDDAEYEELFGSKRAIPWTLVGCIAGWIAAAGLLLLWIFDVGHGPFSSARIGTVGEWVAGIATTTGVGLSLGLVMHERHEREAERLSARRRAYIDRMFGSFSTEMELVDEARRKVPIVARWERVDDGAPDDATDPEAEGRYRIRFELFNGLDCPLADFSAMLLLTGDWTMDDFKGARPWPGRVVLAEHLIVAPGTSFVYAMEKGSYFKLPIERVDNGAYLKAAWTIGEADYDWTRNRSGSTHLFARLPREKRRPRAKA